MNDARIVLNSHLTTYKYRLEIGRAGCGRLAEPAVASNKLSEITSLLRNRGCSGVIKLVPVGIAIDSSKGWTVGIVDSI